MEALRKYQQNTELHPSVLFPDLETFCQELNDTFLIPEAPYNALQFLPGFQKIKSLSLRDTNTLFGKGYGGQVIVHNDLLKIILIHWEPGKFSPVHGHPSGGCVFKVLHGSLVENRFQTKDSDQPLAISNYNQGGIGYIDDTIAYHAVGNESKHSAISIHAYTPGIDSRANKVIK